MKDENQIISEIDTLWNDFVNIKAYFPYIPEEQVGIQSFSSPGYYRQFNINVDFNFSEPLKIKAIKQINHLGNWINQNVLIRLTAILEQSQIICGESSVENNYEGSNEIKILIKLRNKFAHSKGDYNPNNRKNRKLLKNIIDTFGLDDIEYQNYPIPIDRVIKPIFEKCKKYVIQWLDD